MAGEEAWGEGRVPLVPGSSPPQGPALLLRCPWTRDRPCLSQVSRLAHLQSTCTHQRPLLPDSTGRFGKLPWGLSGMPAAVGNQTLPLPFLAWGSWAGAEPPPTPRNETVNTQLL